MSRARVAWVTGGSRGIGAAAAIRLGRQGRDVAVGYHRARSEAADVVGSLQDMGRRAIAVQADLSDPAQVAAAHQQVVEALGDPEVLVASHGVYERVRLADLDAAAWRRTLRVNLTGTFLVTQRVVPAMRSARFGRIVYVGSVLGRTGSTQGAHYGASKAALLGLARSVAHEVAQDGITVNVVSPSMIDTAMIADDTPEKREERARAVPVGRIGTPDDVAAAIAYLSADAAAYVTGTELRVDGGFKMG